MRPMGGGPALLSQGFRPFFLAAGLWAMASLGVFLVAVSGGLSLPGGIDPIAWHVHEMLFGFAAAALAGFLLTAIPNWTGRLPVRGLGLLVLALLWLLARGALLISDDLGPLGLLVLVLAFPAALLGVVGREIIMGKAWRNLPLVLAVAVLLIADGLVLAQMTGLWPLGAWPGRLGVAVFAGLITLIGGRIVPSFTHNWLKARGVEQLPPGFGRFDRITLVITLAALVVWVALPEGGPTGVLCGLAAGANGLRLARWQGHRTLGESLGWVLHLAYGWLVVGLALLAASALSAAVPAVAALHSLTVGAMGTMILAVMSRATLGHGGRLLEAGPALTLAFVLVTVAALGRLAAALLPADPTPLLHGAGFAWIAAFGLYLSVCGPILLTRRRS